MNNYIQNNNIEDIARIVRDKLNLIIPISLQTLCDSISHIGVNAIPVEKDILLDTCFDACIIVDANDITIPYSEWKPPQRILFSIAIEIGNLFLYIIDEHGDMTFDCAFLRQYTNEQAWQSIEFASSFLMPSDEFIKICNLNLVQNETNKNMVIDIESVAKHFNVSYQAVMIRGIRLKIWD